jgi:hypothetical protein
MALLNEVSNKVADGISGVQNELRRLQPSAVGEEEVSSQQAAQAWRKLKLLPPGDFEMVAESMAAKAGHQDGEEELCEWHKFLLEHAGR